MKLFLKSIPNIGNRILEKTSRIDDDTIQVGHYPKSIKMNKMRFSVLPFVLSMLMAVSGTSQVINAEFFNNVDAFLTSNVIDGQVKYQQISQSDDLGELIAQIETANTNSLDAQTRKAFYINAYNLQVISQASQAYPLTSVMDVNGFFDKAKIKVAGKKMSLNDFEKKIILREFKDARLHFVLVCGALGCPPITTFAYRAERLEDQLDMQTRKAVNDPNFIKVNGNKAELSQIFNWYSSDFGSSTKAVLSFINAYRTTPLSQSAKISYYKYDWTLNNVGMGIGQSLNTTSGSNNASRYIVSSTIAKGSAEIKIFNNLYTQRTTSQGEFTDRSTFFTTSVSFLYGASNRFNVGFNTRYRRVHNGPASTSRFEVFNSGEAGSSRQGITAFGPQIRYAPVEKWTNFSIQSSFVLPIGEDLAGSDSSPYIDWTGATWNTQVFNDFPIGNSFSLFTELDFLLEDIGSGDAGHINRFSTPATVIFSYNPNPKTTLYALSGFSPYWQSNFDYFVQAGIGAKYQFTPNVELELLATDFTNQFLANSGGTASTLNIGLRVNL